MNNLLSDRDTKTVLAILMEQLDVREDQLTPDARLEEDLGADSLDKVEIIMTLEDRFSLSIPDEESESISTVGDLLEALGDLLGGPELRRG